MTAAFYIGFDTRYATRLVSSPDRAKRVASLLVDPRWPWRPKSFSTGVLGDFTKRTRSRRVSGSAGGDRILESILDPVTRVIELSCYSVDAKNLTYTSVQTGTHALSSWEQPFKADGQTRAHDLPDPKTIEDWIELIHELMVTLEVASAILPLYETADAVLADTSLISIVSDSRWTGRTDLGPGEGFSEQNRRVNYWCDLLGAATRVGEPICAITTSRRSADSTGFGARSSPHA